MVALMTEALQLKGTEKVLEIGTGSGYQAAILAELADRVSRSSACPPSQRGREGRSTCSGTRTSSPASGMGPKDIWTRAPSSAIIVTAAAPDAPDPLLKQLEIGGRLVIPIGDEQLQDLILYVKDGDDRYHEENYGGCRFVKLIGEHAWTA